MVEALDLADARRIVMEASPKIRDRSLRAPADRAVPKSLLELGKKVFGFPS